MKDRKDKVERKIKAIEQSRRLGERPVGRLLLEMALPATVGQMIMMLYNIIDKYFVANYVGTVAVGAVTIVSPFNMLVSVIGLAVGIGGGAILGRYLGAENYRLCRRMLGTMTAFVFLLTVAVTALGYVFIDPVLRAFGAEGNLLAPSREFFKVVMIGAPMLSVGMLFNNTLRYEGKAVIPMITMALSCLINVILDYVFIVRMGLGLRGAAGATVIAQAFTFVTLITIYLSGNTAIHLGLKHLRIRVKFMGEILGQSVPPYIRQGSIFVTTLFLNHVLYLYGGDEGVAAYGILSSIQMLATFIFIGIAQGSVPIIGYNFGAKKYPRVLETMRVSISSSMAISLVITVLIEIFATPLMSFFTDDTRLIGIAVPGLRIVAWTIPLMGIHNTGAFFFQGIGHAGKALVLTVARQMFLLIPLAVLWALPKGTVGIGMVWSLFPLSDLIATVITILILIPAWRLMRKGLPPEPGFALRPGKAGGVSFD